MALTRQTSRQTLDDKLKRGLLTKQRQRLFLVGMIQPSLTWCALGLSYLLLKSSQANDAIWLSGVLALYALQIIAVWHRSESLLQR